jgi:dTDP-4-amino-4,6-dideoxygalactose transaminase
VAEAAATEVISLPIWPELDEATQVTAVECILRLLCD